MSEPIVRLNAALSGRYEIEREVGEGGMATVFLAKDLKHNRNVGLKVLKPELAAVVGADRFLAEIETTANLQHPHILPLFDSGEADGFLFYVMPYVDGETLRDRINREKQLPVDEAIAIATAVAGALQTAHDQGVVHRDIKPGNILLSRGQPLVADFGIAIAVSAGGGGRLTETGLSLGTPYYMSPEQATGDQDVGPASDTFALACVLYEMLTGEPPYPGTTAQAVLGKIIQGAPVSATAVRRSVPAHVDAAIRKALEKLPADRFASADVFVKALSDPSFRHGQTEGRSAPDRVWKPLAAIMTLLALTSAGGLLYVASRPPTPDPVIRYAMTFEPNESPSVDAGGVFGTSLAVSPDGDRLAYVGPGEESGYQLWIRDRDALSGSPIVGTTNAVQPFFSPDGSRVAYIVTGARELKIVSFGGEPPLTLVGSDVLRLGAAWAPDGYIYYSAQPDAALYRVPSTGGSPERVALPDSSANEARYAFPDPLPGGKGLLVTVLRGNNVYTPEDDVGVLDLRTGTVTVLFRGTLARYLPTGHILFVTHEGDVLTAPFDEARLEITGPTTPLFSGLVGSTRGPDLAISASGRLVYQGEVTGSADVELVFADRSGLVTPLEEGWTMPLVGRDGPSLSPDGRRITFSVPQAAGGGDIWVKEIGGPMSRLAFGQANIRPRWSVDGQSVLYMTNRPGDNFDLVSQPADGSGVESILLDAEWPVGEVRPSPDGETLVIRRNDNPADIYMLRPGDEVATPLLEDEFIKVAPSVSPDGRFLAYSSNISGRFEVYVRPFPDVGEARVAVSTAGGTEPLWAHSGNELFYRSAEGELVAATVSTEGGFQVVSRETLFPFPPVPSASFPRYTRYDVTADDQRFLMMRLVGGPAPVADDYTVVENFHQEVLRATGS